MVDTIVYVGASVAWWMDTVLRMPFLSMGNVCLVTLTIGKGTVELGIRLFRVAVAFLLAFLVKEAVSGGLTILTRCPGENEGVF